MKLFIVNKEDFDFDFPNSQSVLHKKAYNFLLQSIGYDDSIPDNIEINYDMFVVNFEYLNKKNDVYFYQYSRK